MPATHDTSITLTLASGAIASGIHVESVYLREAVSDVYAGRINFRSDRQIADADVVGERARLELETEAGKLLLYGVVIEFAAEDPLGDQGHVYRVTIAPRLDLLKLSRQNQVYGTASKVSIKDILEKELEGSLGANHGHISIEHELNLTASYRKREFIVQYQESDFAFLSRWCESSGVFYFFKQGTDGETVSFADNNVAFVESAAASLPYRHGHGAIATAQAAVTSFGFVARPIAKSVVLRDYNPDRPSLTLRSSSDVAGGKIGTVIEYGPHFLDPAEGDYLARVRAEEIACRARVFQGVSNAPQLRPGVFFSLTGHPSLDDRYLVIAVEHEVATPAPSGYGSAEAAAGQPYGNRFEAIPLSAPFRPERKTPRPLAAGLFTAFIDGEADGSRAEIDEQGRYKVRLRYDEGDSADGRASEFLRKAEPYAGPADTGMHFPLLKGTEVVLCCVNGDIDRPIIVGAVPNPLTPNVVAKGNNTINRFRSPAGTLFEMNDGPAG